MYNTDKPTALVIMAAGIGSRFGGGIKQLAKVGPNDEIIMDYSIHDAIRAGFNKIIFIIRKDIETEFTEAIGNRIEKICAQHGVDTVYAYQDLQDIPGELPSGRSKPWGTGQAVLRARDKIDMPFAVINADDYYGKDAYISVHDWLVENYESKTDYCMAGFVLKNTLSDNGGVTRGICSVDENNFLTYVDETKNIVKTADGAESDGKKIDTDSYVSMNMWGLTPYFVNTLRENFKVFFERDVPSNPMKAEYLLPILIGELLEKKEVTVKLLPTHDKWFGVTYKEDKDAVIDAFKELVENGDYNKDLYSDIK